jgi:hypothetical protein
VAAVLVVDEDRIPSCATTAESVPEAAKPTQYKRIHQHLDEEYEWKEMTIDTENKVSVKFEVYHRHHKPTSMRPIETFVKLRCESLRKALTICLPSVHILRELQPMV